MRTKNFKIRTPIIQAGEAMSPQRSDKSIGQKGSNITQEQFKEFFNMFKTIMSQSLNSQTQNQSLLEGFQPRDREIIVEPPQPVDGFIQEKHLKIWATTVFRTVFSSSFNYYSKGEMSFQQAKIYCSQNIFKNLVILNKQYRLSPKEYQMLDNHIQGGVLNYLGSKYPLTDSTQINKKLQEIVREVDNIEALSNNYLASYSGVNFQYRDDGNYNDLIMKLINEVKDILDLEQADQETTYDDFEEFMTNLFEKVMNNDWMKKNDREIFAPHHLKFLHAHSNIDGPQKSENNDLPDNITDFKEQMRKKAEQKQKYKAKVKEYTHYVIGRKIPENTPNYTEKEIKSKNITIKSPAILRILTKWCAELQKKYFEPRYYTNRSQRTKVQKGRNINILLSWMKIEIDKKLQIQKDQVVKFMEEITDNNFEMQSKIMLKELEKEEEGFHIDEVQKISGKFSSKIVKNVHSYIIAYLNRLIHGLMKIAKEIYEEHQLYKSSDWPTPPNLLSFKISDIMRCKCSSKQRQIVRIYKEIERISKENPQKFKIVRIKDRLRTGTNDILINVKFNNKILCQIQLAIKTHISDFINCSNAFHHYIYELQRSNFGPLTELCSIWNTLDRRSQIYQELIEQQQAHKIKSQHICPRLIRKTEMIRYNRPFICSQCSIAFFHNNYLRPHVKCKYCQYFVCSNCQIESRNEQKLKIDLIKDRDIRNSIIQRIDKDEPLPKFGICIFLQSKTARVELFQHLNYEKNRKDYLFGKKNDKIYQIQDIKTSKANKEFRKKHLIFSVDQDRCPHLQQLTKQEINFYILSQTVKKNYQKEKQSMSLLGQRLTNEDCRKILNVGGKHEKENVKHLLLSDNKLTQLPFNPREFPNLRWLTLSRNFFTSYKYFDKLKHLKTFIWHGGRLQQIPKDIYEIIGLEELACSRNKITYISPNIAQMKHLKLLQLESNRIKEIPQQIQQCENLVSLKMEANMLTTLPSALFNLKNLEILLVNSNHLKEIPEQISKLKKLKLLNIAYNQQIEVLPKSLTTLTTLELLNCSHTRIKEISEDISNLINLKEIKWNNIHIKHIPSTITQLSKLEKLSLSDLCQAVVGDQIGNLTRLKQIDIKGCRIKELPNLKKLQKLQILDVSSNFLTELDHDVIINLASLSKLEASNNKFQKFPCLNRLKKLSYLDLSLNDISKIDDQDLKYNINIEEFIMTDNTIEYLPSSFQQLIKLRKLNLKENKMKKLIEEEWEDELNQSGHPIWPNLVEINLNYNKFEEIPKYLFFCTKIVDLYLSFNQLKQFPNQIYNLKRLKNLEIIHNDITELDQKLKALDNLVSLYVSGNKIKKIPEFIKSLPKLKEFRADNCGVEEIQSPQWMINNEENMILGILPDIAYKLIYGEDRLSSKKKLEEEKKMSQKVIPNLERTDSYDIVINKVDQDQEDANADVDEDIS